MNNYLTLCNAGDHYNLRFLNERKDLVWFHRAWLLAANPPFI